MFRMLSAVQNICIDIFEASFPSSGKSVVIVTPQGRNTSSFEKHFPYFIVDRKLRQRWEVPLHSLFALGFQPQNFLVDRDAAQIIVNTKLLANNVGTLSNRSWYTLLALRHLIPGHNLIKLTRKNISYATLIDIQFDLLHILDNYLNFIERFA